MGKNKGFTFRLMLLLVAGLLLSACAAQTEVVPVEMTPTPPEAALVQETPEMDDNAPAEQQANQESTETLVESTQTPDPRIPEPELGFAYGDANLKATDPGSFVRAAGKPQLVELFAFW